MQSLRRPRRSPRSIKCVDFVAAVDPRDPLTHILVTCKWKQVQGRRERNAPVVVHADLGLLVMGTAPPRGQANRLARGAGQHRFVQNPRGALEDVSALRTEPLEGAQNMMRLLPGAAGLLGTDHFPFMNEYSDGCTPNEYNDRDGGVTVTADGEQQGGADDMALWVNSRREPRTTTQPHQPSASPLQPHTPQSVVSGLSPGSQLRAAAALAQSTVLAYHNPSVVLLQGDRQSFLFGVQRGRFLADCFEPQIAMIADGYLTLVIAVPDPGMVRRRADFHQPFQLAMDTLFDVLRRHALPSTSGSRLLFSPPRPREELERLRKAIAGDPSMQSVWECRDALYRATLSDETAGSTPPVEPPLPTEQEARHLVELSEGQAWGEMDFKNLLQHAIETFEQSGAETYVWARNTARRACAAVAGQTAWKELTFRRKLLLTLAGNQMHRGVAGGLSLEACVRGGVRASRVLGSIVACLKSGDIKCMHESHHLHTYAGVANRLCELLSLLFCLGCALPPQAHAVAPRTIACSPR
jgi:hypothetical protein